MTEKQMFLEENFNDYSLEVLVEEIQNIKNELFFNESMELKFDKKTSDFVKKQEGFFNKVIDKEIKKYDENNEIMTLKNNYVKETKKIFKSNDNIKNKISNYKELTNSTVSSLKMILEKIGEHLGEFILAFLLILIINTAVCSILQLIFIPLFGSLAGPVLGFILTCCIIAPLTEEFFKRYYIKKGLGKEWCTFFSTAEFCQYILKFLTNPVLRASITLPKFIIGRMAAASMHFATYKTQEILYNKAKETNNEKLEKLSYVVGVIEHMAWNLLASIPTINQFNQLNQLNKVTKEVDRLYNSFFN